MARLAAFCMLLYKVWSQQSVAGVSLKSLQCYAVVFLFHFLSVVRHQGYLPFDSSGDWVYQLIAVVARCAGVGPASPGAACPRGSAARWRRAASAASKAARAAAALARSSAAH